MPKEVLLLAYSKLNWLLLLSRLKKTVRPNNAIIITDTVSSIIIIVNRVSLKFAVYYGKLRFRSQIKNEDINFIINT